MTIFAACLAMGAAAQTPAESPESQASVPVATSLTHPVAVQAPVKIGVVDKDAIIQAMPETAAAQQQLTAASLRYKQEQQSLEDKMKAYYEIYRDTSPGELPAIRDRKTRDFIDQQGKVQEFEQRVQKELSELQKQLMAPIYTKLQDALRAVGAEGGYTVILDKNMDVLYSPDSIDLTQQVKARLGL